MAVGADGVAGSFRSIEQSAIRSKTAVEALFASMKAAPPKIGGFGPGSFKGGAGGGVDREVLAGIRREEQERERSLRHVAGIKERYLREEQSREEQADKRRERAILQRAQYQEREADRAAKRPSWAARLAGGASRMGFDAAGGAAMAVTGAAVMAARQAYQLEEAATRISINARQAGQDFVDPRVLRREFEATAQASPGVKAIDVADAVQQFITVTGDLDTARKSQKTFATVASATGSSVGDVAQAAAALSMQMGIKGEGEMKEVMASLVQQGKSGSFELRDAASLFPRLAAAAGGFGVEKSAQGVKTLGALTQVARGATGSGEQATTAVENIFTNLKMKSGKLEGMGVQVYNQNGTSRNIVDILTESVAKVGGKDLAKKQAGLQQIFGEQGGRAINPLTSTYIDVFTAQMKAGAKEQDAIAAATKAVKKKMTDFIDGAGDWKEVQKDAARAQESATAKLTASWEKLVASAGDKLAPGLAKLADGLSDSRFLDAMAATIEGFGLLAEAAGNIAKMLGIEKKETPYETENRTKKALEDFDEKQGIGPLTPAKATERKRLELAYSTAHEMAWQKPKSIGSFEDFNAQLGGADIGESARRSMYTQAVTNPDAYRATMEQDAFLGKVGLGSGIDDKSRDVVNSLIEQVKAAQATGTEGPKLDEKEAAGALARLVGVFVEARAAMSEAIAGDLLGGQH